MSWREESWKSARHRYLRFTRWRPGSRNAHGLRLERRRTCSSAAAYRHDEEVLAFVGGAVVEGGSRFANVQTAARAPSRFLMRYTGARARWRGHPYTCPRPDRPDARRRCWAAARGSSTAYMLLTLQRLRRKRKSSVCVFLGEARGGAHRPGTPGSCSGFITASPAGQVYRQKNRWKGRRAEGQQYSGRACGNGGAASFHRGSLWEGKGAASRQEPAKRPSDQEVRCVPSQRANRRTYHTRAHHPRAAIGAFTLMDFNV